MKTFLIGHMDYQKHYNLLINRARTRVLTGYKEKHHIIPKCMGGSDNAENLVELTPEEHFLAHQLLVKIYPGNRSLRYALSRMICVSKKHKGNRSLCKMYGWIRKEIKHSFSGENNPSAKFTNEEVVEIYHSSSTLDFLAEKYGVTRYNIITIKRKIFYSNVTKDIKELPGFSDEDLHKKGGGFPLPIDLIENVFYDTGSYAYFWERYRITPVVVKSIKTKKSFKRITSNLGSPGRVSRYGMTREEIEEIYSAVGTNKEIAERFGVHYNTVRNIKGKYSRALSIWEDF